ncbi:MAG: hypothetical protein HYW50_00260 [Candidatus Diapherotrites archaeon]|nr:hypothetical protein [Candidatus Diapherotrites archaeon]
MAKKIDIRTKIAIIIIVGAVIAVALLLTAPPNTSLGNAVEILRQG